jgi:UDP-N-acetylmuramate-alanine ligase
VRAGDVIAMMGAGSISGVAHDLAAQLTQRGIGGEA